MSKRHNSESRVIKPKDIVYCAEVDLTKQNSWKLLNNTIDVMKSKVLGKGSKVSLELLTNTIDTKRSNKVTLDLKK